MCAFTGRLLAASIAHKCASMGCSLLWPVPLSAAASHRCQQQLGSSRAVCQQSLCIYKLPSNAAAAGAAAQAGRSGRKAPHHCREQPATEGVGLPSGAAEEQHRILLCRLPGLACLCVCFPWHAPGEICRLQAGIASGIRRAIAG